MNNLYISDLDGTLLNNSASLSEYTESSLNKIINSGIKFTIASARSIASINKIFKNVAFTLPVIEFNGAFISNLASGEHLIINSINTEMYNELTTYFTHEKLNYLVSSFNRQRDMLYYEKIQNDGVRWYIEDRQKNKDPRLQRINTIQNIEGEDIICLTIIDTYERLKNYYTYLQDISEIEVHLLENQYSPGWLWLTVHSARATKDQAIKELVNMEKLQSHRIVVFGDNTNDIKMMKTADLAIAVSNAKSEVMATADKIIASNLDDGVVKYILENENI